MRVVFLGNHTVGVRALEVICREAELVGVVAHPSDPEDGVRYESVYAAAQKLGVPTIRANGRAAELRAFVEQSRPELLWITDYRYLLPSDLLRLPRYGAINLHPSLLPRYRGRAPINWAILHGETELGLTAHVVDAGIDSGEIVTQRRYTLTQEQDVGDALRLLYPLYADITTQVLRELKAGRVFRTPQNHADATTFPRRTPEEGAIEWNVPAREVWNFIRAVAAPYPGAFTSAGDGVIRIWRANGIERFASGAAPQPGEVLCINRDATELMVACADAALLIQIFELEGGATLPRVGDRLTLADPATVDFLSQ